MNWLELAKEAQNDAKGAGAEKGRARAAINEFADWAHREGIPFGGPAAEDTAIIERFGVVIEHHRNPAGNWNKQGMSALTWAKELLQRGRRITEEAALEATRTAAHEEMMPKEMEEEFDEEQDGADEDDGGADDEEEEVSAASSNPRKRAKAPPPAPIYVQVPQQRQAKAPRGPAAAPTSKLIPRMEKVRLFKRDERGKKVLIDDYSVEDLAGQKLTDFIEEVVHPRFANEGLSTEYIAFEVDPRTDRERGPAFRVSLEPNEAAQDDRDGRHDPFQTVHRAMGLIKELQGEKPEPEKNPALAAMQQKAAQTGDMNGVIMMMMMEKLFNGQQRTPGPDSELLMKLVDRLDRLEGRKSDGQPFQPPPWMMQPPAPAPIAPMTSAMDKVMELAVAKLAAPPPSTFEMAKELAGVQQLLAGPKNQNSDELSAMRNEMSALRSAIASKPKGGLEESLETFEKVTTMVKSVAPQVGGGEPGFAGFLKGLLTPEVAKTIAGVVGAASQGQGQQAGISVQQGNQQVPASQGPQAPAQVAAAPRDFTKPPNPPPPGVVDASKAFLLAQTPPARAEKFSDFIIAMFMSGDPYYQTLLKEPMEALNTQPVTTESLKPARRLAMLLIAEQKPEIATPEFVDVCIASLASKVGVEVPEALVKSAGAWTLDFKGAVVMLETVARPVPRTEPAKVEVAPAAPSEPTITETPLEEAPPLKSRTEEEILAAQGSPIPLIHVVEANREMAGMAT